MIQSISSDAQRFLSTMASLNDRLDRVQQQVASGKRLTKSSDEPDSVTQLLSVRAQLARVEQTQSNLSRVKTEVDTAEASLEAAVSLYDRVRTLGMTGAGTNQTAQTRQTIADELGGILERMVGLANTSVDGRYVFSGDTDQQTPFSYDGTAVPPWGVYQGSVSTRQTMHPLGVTYAIATDGQEIFDNADPARNVFATIDTLRNALLSNDDAAIKAAVEPLAGVSSHLNSMLSFYGNVQSQTSDATNTASKMKVQLETQLSATEDADITQAIVELQQLRFNQQAALQVRGSMPQQTLFDYLK